MTQGELKIRILEDYPEASMEDLIGAIILMVAADKDQYLKGSPDGEAPHPLVVRCLDATIQHLEDASFAYYASLK